MLRNVVARLAHALERAHLARVVPTQVGTAEALRDALAPVNRAREAREVLVALAVRASIAVVHTLSHDAEQADSYGTNFNTGRLAFFEGRPCKVLDGLMRCVVVARVGGEAGHWTAAKGS